MMMNMNGIDIVDVGKYQSIADRIKRLGNKNTQPQNTSVTLSNQGNNVSTGKLRSQLSPRNNISQQRIKPPMPPKMIAPRTMTQQTEEESANQQSALKYDQYSGYSNTRDNRINQILNKPRGLVRNDSNNPYNSFEEMGRKDSYHKEQYSKENVEKSRSGLSKIKSQNSLKINQILESFNNYKLNKEQFLSDIKKSHPSRQRIVSRNLKEELNRNSHQDQEPRPSIRMESDINSIWNETPHKQQQMDRDYSFDKVRRSEANHTPTQPKQIKKRQLTNFVDPTEDQSPSDVDTGYRHQNLKLHNLASPPPENRTPAFGELVSPRLRVPGKICKNHDKSAVLS